MPLPVPQIPPVFLYRAVCQYATVFCLAAPPPTLHFSLSLNLILFPSGSTVLRLSVFLFSPPKYCTLPARRVFCVPSPRASFFFLLPDCFLLSFLTYLSLLLYSPPLPLSSSVPPRLLLLLIPKELPPLFPPSIFQLFQLSLSIHYLKDPVVCQTLFFFSSSDRSTRVFSFLLSSLPLPPPGRSVCSRSIPGGGRLGQEELMSGGGRPHADGVSRPHHPLQTCGKPQEDGQE